jgi:dolichyl-phosphate-mannose-protein mannosyltransferase
MFQLFGETVRPIFFVQSIISAGAVGLMFLAVRSLLNVKIALLAATIQAIDPFDIYYANFPSTESFTASLISAITFLGFICARQARSTEPMPWSSWIALILILGVGCLHRSTFALLTLIVIAYILILRFITVRNFRDVLLKSAGAVVLLSIVLSPWLVRNYMLWGRMVYESKAGINLLIGNNERSRGYFDLKHLPPMNPNYNEIQRDDEYKRLAFDWISKNPLQAFFLLIKKNFMFWNPVPFDKHKGPLFYVGLIWSAFLVGFFLDRSNWIFSKSTEVPLTIASYCWLCIFYKLHFCEYSFSSSVDTTDCAFRCIRHYVFDRNSERYESASKS